eukprot:scaffold5380_cov131-Cylindrotheca_fusiformis.AAC.2
MKQPIFILSLALVAAISSRFATAQDLLDDPQVLWSEQLDAEFSYGNGVFLTPDGSELIAITTEGLVTSYDPDTGDENWTVDPPSVEDGSSNSIESHSGITFSTANSDSNFMVYSVSYPAEQDTDTAYTKVVAINMNGDKLFESPTLTGIHSGSPLISDDGQYVFLTHNSADRTTGYFTVLNASLIDVVTRSYADGPFGPPGIYHSPAEGFYDPIPEDADPADYTADGTDNTNDMIIWSNTIVEDDVSVEDGFLFGFQFQDGYESDTDSINYFVLGDSRTYRTITPPVITNEGRSLYLSASRSQYKANIGQQGLDAARFNRGPNLRVDFETNDDWRGQPIWCIPAISSDPTGDAVVYGGNSINQIFRLHHPLVLANDTDYDIVEKFIAAPLFASPIVDPLSRAVYFAARDGTLYQRDIETLEDVGDFDCAQDSED